MTKVDLYARRWKIRSDTADRRRSTDCFAQATQQPISYERLEGPLDGFEEFALGLAATPATLGLNVTIPFKLDASKTGRLADPPGRDWPGRSNTLKFDEDTIYGDNTGRGRFFVRDISQRLGFKGGQTPPSWCWAAGGGSARLDRLLAGGKSRSGSRWPNRTHGRAPGNWPTNSESRRSASTRSRPSTSNLIVKRPPRAA